MRHLKLLTQGGPNLNSFENFGKILAKIYFRVRENVIRSEMFPFYEKLSYINCCEKCSTQICCCVPAPLSPTQNKKRSRRPIRGHIYTHTLTHSYPCTLTHSYPHTLTHLHPYILTPPHTHTLTYSYIPSHTHTPTYSHTHTLIPSHTYTPT